MPIPQNMAPNGNRRYRVIVDASYVPGNAQAFKRKLLHIRYAKSMVDAVNMVSGLYVNESSLVSISFKVEAD